MPRSNSKQSGGIHVVSPEEKEKLRWEGFAHCTPANIHVVCNA